MIERKKLIVRMLLSLGLSVPIFILIGVFMPLLLAVLGTGLLIEVVSFFVCVGMVIGMWLYCVLALPRMLNRVKWLRFEESDDND